MLTNDPTGSPEWLPLVLMALQGAILAGIYSVDDHATAVLVTVVGLVLTGLLWQIAERDQFHRDAAFADSGVLRSTRVPPWYLNLKARYSIRLVFIILMVSDVAVLLKNLYGPYSYWFTVPLLMIACVTWHHSWPLGK